MAFLQDEEAQRELAEELAEITALFKEATDDKTKKDLKHKLHLARKKYWMKQHRDLQARGLKESPVPKQPKAIKQPSDRQSKPSSPRLR